MKNKKTNVLMGHIVAGYPTKEMSVQAGFGICKGGAKYLEVQFPFSDPNADGTIIESACVEALKNGFKIEDGFDIIKNLSENTSSEILIVTYANIVYSYGIKNFVKRAKQCGAKGIIVPDLPFEEDEGLRKFALEEEIKVIELIAPGITPERIKKLSKTPSDFVYVVARTGITGKKTHINQDLFEWIEFVRSNCNKKIALGFGINSNSQIKALQGKVDIVVVGSYFVQKITSHKKNIQSFLQKYATDLLSF
ncbi:tryptophan synthase subunit alpha [Helicobacter cappadocius]|uniref:Tryptophan synthase alpha chain n=1 Tax=Helicobacter cappadocius TaxID=3063998 RepID=A0AA90PK98_9HELI|nr:MULTISPECIES: tryptophan synthase subunit alpha [unclassified Helicobacter]MDO7252940.1 tryptophan synthase subunit alpha [Helicobacter sp. faydin-H75]MDP2539070.1 tryptophan synthase subunit alpha [Helicobacter sp. faydin-H76]